MHAAQEVQPERGQQKPDNGMRRRRRFPILDATKRPPVWRIERSADRRGIHR